MILQSPNVRFYLKKVWPVPGPTDEPKRNPWTVYPVRKMTLPATCSHCRTGGQLQVLCRCSYTLPCPVAARVAIDVCVASAGETTPGRQESLHSMYAAIQTPGDRRMHTARSTRLNTGLLYMSSCSQTFTAFTEFTFTFALSQRIHFLTNIHWSEYEM